MLLKTKKIIVTLIIALLILPCIDPAKFEKEMEVKQKYLTFILSDFCVGSSEDTINDIVPCTWVGYNTSGKVYIKGEYLYIDDFAYRKLSELRAFAEEFYGFEEENSNEFLMETGRTLFLYMRLCNKAQRCSVKFVNSLLITNNQSVLLRSADGSGIQLDPQSGHRGKRTTDHKLLIDLPPGKQVVLV